MQCKSRRFTIKKKKKQQFYADFSENNFDHLFYFQNIIGTAYALPSRASGIEGIQMFGRKLLV